MSDKIIVESIGPSGGEFIHEYESFEECFCTIIFTYNQTDAVLLKLKFKDLVIKDFSFLDIFESFYPKDGFEFVKFVGENLPINIKTIIYKNWNKIKHK